MVVLALDTTSRHGSSAVAVDGRVVREQPGDPSVPQAARVPGELQTLLAGCGLSLADVDLFAVAVGPGSFTGLRVGIATMQGLAFDRDQPLVGVSAVDALAAIAGREGGGVAAGERTATWIDAWRGEVYAALYDGTTEIEPVSVEPPPAILSRLTGDVLFIGDGVHGQRETITRTLGERARFAPDLAPPLAGAVALLAAAAAAAGHRPTADEIRPLYVRRPDAEIARDARATR